MSAHISETEIRQEKTEGLRQRKRRETHNRIAATGLKLFIDKGFEATTLDMIAEAAGISRRTFFHYFKSKEDLLLARETSNFPQALHTSMLGMPRDQQPLSAAMECLLNLASRYESKESLTIDRLLHSTEALRARKSALYVDMERILVSAMGELWPIPEQRATHRVVAMIVIGALRLAMEDWRREEAQHPVAHYLQRNFSLIENQF